MFIKSLVTASATSLLLATGINADGLYSKGSSVLQVDGKSYEKLIGKATQVSVKPNTF